VTPLADVFATTGRMRPRKMVGWPPGAWRDGYAHHPIASTPHRDSRYDDGFHHTDPFTPPPAP
jgi:hypothetical protein